MDTQRAFYASCARGLEGQLEVELQGLGAVATRAGVAGVAFGGGQEAALGALIWSRLASRVMVELNQFPARDEAALYAGIKAMDWPREFAPETTFAIKATTSRSALSHSIFAAQRAKDGIVDAFRDAGLPRPDVDPDAPDVQLRIALHDDIARVLVDLSGVSLHRRGYRLDPGPAPLRETVAAAVLMRGRWPKIAAAGGVLIDPMCGAGTLPIEAVLMAADIAPWFAMPDRTTAVPTRWLGLDQDAWDAAAVDARHRADAGRAGDALVAFGFDNDADAIVRAQAHISAAGLDGRIVVEQRAIRAFARPPSAKQGLVVVNPPYDARLAADDVLYAALGDALRDAVPDLDAAIIASIDAPWPALGLAPDRVVALKNGAIDCHLALLQPIGGRSARPRGKATGKQGLGKPVAAEALDEGSAMVANRLRRNLRHTGRRMAKADIDCFRLYDADLPEYSAAIDIYQEADDPRRRYAVVQEYAAPATIDPAVAKGRLGQLVEATSAVLEVPRGQIIVKARQRQRGGQIYDRKVSRVEPLVVREGPARFEVELRSRIDTGLYLDQRDLRARIHAAAGGADVLNLFGYTGTASVMAALGGARTTTTVDLSATYLEWAGRNFALNGIHGAAHSLVRGDAMAYAQALTGPAFDIIYCDPPTFSNSASAADFDVARDHVVLVEYLIGALKPGGRMWFSNHLRGFKLDPAVADRYAVEDVSAATLPEDFGRRPRIRHVFEVQQHQDS